MFIYLSIETQLIHVAKCLYAKCRYAECQYAECRYAECRGAVFDLFKELSVQTAKISPIDIVVDKQKEPG